MPYDPTYPPTGAPLLSAPMRGQFNSLKELIDSLVASAEPIGTVKAWLKDFPGTPPLSAHWLECNGQTVSDPASPYDGMVLPDLNNGEFFLRGSPNSGNTGGQTAFATATADFAGVGPSFAAVTPDFSPGASPFPPYYTVVWVMRVR
jgi:hypothetical protein